MTGKLTLLIGFGAGYVLGARSGRERYDQIAAKAQQLWHDPRVQEKAGQAQQLAQEKAGQAGQAVKEKVSSSSGGSSSGSASNGSDSTVSGTSAGTVSSGSATGSGSMGGKLP
jgi:hypothetical protein